METILSAVAVKLVFSLWFWIVLGLTYLTLSVLFILYLAYAAVDEAKRRGERPPAFSKFLAGPLLGVAAVLDVTLLNGVIGTVLFLELPIMSGPFQDRTFTHRLRIHKGEVMGFRGVLARFFSRQLDWAVSGDHV